MGNHRKTWGEVMRSRSLKLLKLSTSDHLLPTFVSRWAIKAVNKINGSAHLSTFAHLFLIEHRRRRNSNIQGSYREKVGKVGRWTIGPINRHLSRVQTRTPPQGVMTAPERQLSTALGKRKCNSREFPTGGVGIMAGVSTRSEKPTKLASFITLVRHRFTNPLKPGADYPLWQGPADRTDIPAYKAVSDRNIHKRP